MLGALQLVHLVLLFAVPIAYALLTTTGDSSDLNMQRLTKLTTILAVVWTSSVAVGAVLYGAKEDLLRSLWSSYRSMLMRYPFLVVSNLALALVAALLLWHLTAYRSVTFYADRDVTLILNDEVGEVVEVGRLTADTDSKIRLRIGTRHLAYRVLDSGAVGSLEPLEVPAWWSSRSLSIVRVSPEESYEAPR
jgi:hypothetical protein